MAEIKKLGDVKFVPLDYSKDYIRVVVVAAKLPGGKGRKWSYIASSVLLIAKKGGVDEFVTHDVVAANDLESLARVVNYLFAVVRFRAAIGLPK